MDVYALGPQDHGHMLSALRELLSDGRARTVEDLCAEAIKRGLVPASTKPKYFFHAVDTVIDRAQLRGEKPEFVVLLDGRIRLNIPIDPFAAHKDPDARSAELDEFIKHLEATAYRRVTPGKDDPQDIGLPFERDVAAALNLLGLIARQEGGMGRPDVFAVPGLDRGDPTWNRCPCRQ